MKIFYVIIFIRIYLKFFDEQGCNYFYFFFLYRWKFLVGDDRGNYLCFYRWSNLLIFLI